ncbi:DUF1643 domain-containing protein [Dyella marensis]|uniref:DUF1643 domain-containing protein n=1 Tax=Dyella marensis TaxID=500610 RepID=A0A1I2A3S2_9GAMM|nr:MULTISPECIES: DUF1643 domain-containing protein [Dyella]SFE38611.1 hypothetical protein SAMN02799615_00914 [Dyella marensis]
MSDLFSLQNDSVISPCGQWRYLIRERWAPGPIVGWVCHNPSTADHLKADNTKTRMRNFSITWEFGGFWVGNRYAGGRSPNPGDLDGMDDPVGPDNDRWLAELARSVDLIVVGWGDLFATPERTARVVEILHASGKPLHCLGANRNGSPKHPLYVSGAARPLPWPATPKESRA